ncbi:MAG: hypothetical protein DMG75_01045, partial [Acidobacteria bacterium]
AVLEKEGYAVLSATDSQQAIEMLLEAPVSLVLSDHMLRGTTGVELAQQMKALKPDVPIVLYSGTVPKTLGAVDLHHPRPGEPPLAIAVHSSDSSDIMRVESSPFSNGAAASRPLSRRPQNNVVALIAGDDPIKLLKLFRLACRDAQFFHFKCARVANHIPFYFRLGVITCEAVFRVDRRRQVIHLVAGGHCDFKRIRVPRRSIELDGKISRFFRLQQSPRFGSNHPRPHQKQIAGALCVILGFK